MTESMNANTGLRLPFFLDLYIVKH
jgi:hypothetical protein